MSTSILLVTKEAVKARVELLTERPKGRYQRLHRALLRIERGMRIIGGKWKGSILWHLQEGPVRFNTGDLARQLGGASKKMVTQRLKEMEDIGLVKRKVLSTRPVAVAYEITEFGRSSLAVLEQLKEWAEENGL